MRIVVLIVAALLGTTMTVAQAQPAACPQGYSLDGNGCMARLTAVVADGTAGSLTGTPVGTTTPVTVFAEPASYLPSVGFGSDPPELVGQWDAAIAGVAAFDPADPGWYGQGKARAFLPRQLNGLAAQMPPGTIVVRGTANPADAHLFELRSIQPVA